MHISLTPELENMVKERVQSGLYNNGSEVIRAALRNFFHVSDEADYMKHVIAPRLDDVLQHQGSLQSFDDAMDEIESDVFGRDV